MTRGVFEGLGRLTHNIAEVSEHCCQMGGGAYCEYHIKWKPKAFYSRWMDLLRYHVSHEVVDELEHKIEEINDIRLKQEKIIAQRTKELEKQRRTVLRAHRILSRYVPAQLSRKVIAGEVAPIWGHRRSKLSMFFSDIKDFTAFIEITEPEDMAVLLNEYFVCMNAVIDRYGGTLANINGDGLFVFFGAPDQTGDKDHALRCVGMAVHMQRKMQKLQKKWFAAGVENTLQIRCGINTGMATVGGFGSSERKNYTAMGKHVNLASRLESACPPGSVLISHSTWALVKDRIRCEPRGQIRVKGFTSPVRVYEVKCNSSNLSVRKVTKVESELK
jgi:class 3 adenylate cyclase